MVGCAAVNCGESQGQGIALFRFPKNVQIRDQWAKICKNTPTTNSRLCECHFKVTQIRQTPDGLKRLETNAIPTIFTSTLHENVNLCTNLKLKMEDEVQSKLESEISLTTDVSSTSGIGHLNEPFSYEGLVEHAFGSIDTGTNLKLKMEEVKPEGKNEMLLPSIAVSTSDVPYLHEIKKEFSLSEAHSYGGLVEHTVASIKCEMQSLDLQIKSEISDLKCDIKSDNDNIYIKLEQLVNEELHIKNEVEENLVKTNSQVKLFCCKLCNSEFEFIKDLQQHVNDRAKPFRCNMCDYKSKRKVALLRHVKTHRKKKPLIQSHDISTFQSINQSMFIGASNRTGLHKSYINKTRTK